ncbi:MAG TPA: PIG-L family deacetylase [Kofleriaceae bacterium]|nr:PIG-L family deacetylase [Kofleriaceae bacterium]
MMRAVAALWCSAAALAMTSCGDNVYPDGVPLPVVSRVNIVAHPDDDLIFMQPDSFTAVTRGDAIITVYVTAGQAKKDLAYADDRERAVLYAYQVASGATGWDCGTISLADHLAEHCAAIGAHGPVSLVFLGLPDGGPPGNFPGSLLSLWSGKVDYVRTVARRSQRYTEDDVVAVLADVLRQSKPAQVYTLDVLATHELDIADHSDHTLVGAATARAVAAAQSLAPIVSFRGYNVLVEPENKPLVMYDAVSIMMRGYGACTETCGRCGEQVCSSISEYHQKLLSRRYATSFRTRNETMRLQLGGYCLTTAGSAVLLGDCAAAPAWQLRGDRIMLAGACLTAQLDGGVRMATCDGSAAQWWRQRDEGEFVGGIAPLRVDDMKQRHTLCLGSAADAAGAAVQGLTCGAEVAPKWATLPVWQATNVSATGSLGLSFADVTGDSLADLCELRSGGVFCGKGNGAGSFARLQQADADGTPWQGSDFVVGRDVGTSGKGAFACTAYDSELRCAPLLSGARASFVRTLAAPAVPSSLALVDVNGDGALDVCVQHSALQCFDQRGEVVFSRDGNSALQLLDIDHDGLLDRCGIAGGQLQCAIAADVAWRDASIVWAYANRGAWESLATPAANAGIVWADLDGDAVLDACVAGDSVRCTFGNRYGLGPSFAVATPLARMSRVWLADLAGTGAHNVCIAGAAAEDATVYCSSPARF